MWFYLLIYHYVGERSAHFVGFDSLLLAELQWNVDEFKDYEIENATSDHVVLILNDPNTSINGKC